MALEPREQPRQLRDQLARQRDDHARDRVLVQRAVEVVQPADHREPEARRARRRRAMADEVRRLDAGPRVALQRLARELAQSPRADHRHVPQVPAARAQMTQADAEGHAPGEQQDQGDDREEADLPAAVVTALEQHVPEQPERREGHADPDRHRLEDGGRLGVHPAVAPR